MPNETVRIQRCFVTLEQFMPDVQDLYIFDDQRFHVTSTYVSRELPL